MTATRDPILLLHGFAAFSGILLPLETHLRRRLRRPVRSLQLGAGLLDVREDASIAFDLLDEWADLPGFGHADVVGHSMGGLVATYLLKCIDGGDRIRRVVTLGTPHRGAPIAIAGAAVLGVLSPAVWQMVPGADLLEDIAEHPVPRGSRLVSVAGDRDLVVPCGYSVLPDAPGHGNVRLSGVHHLDLLRRPRALELVARLLEA